MMECITNDASLIERNCDVNLNFITSVNHLNDNGTIDHDDVYSIKNRSNKDPELDLVIINRADQGKKFIVKYGFTQIPCPGIHKPWQIEEILEKQTEFPIPIELLSKDVMEKTLVNSRSFIDSFMERGKERKVV